MAWLSTILKFLLLIVLITSASLYFLFNTQYATTLKYASETITIERNQVGIPYVKSPSYLSVMYGWGYVTAQDRLFQLAFRRTVGRGKLSKYLGKRTLNIDKFVRQLNFAEWAKKSADRLKRQNLTQYKNFASYVQGINDQVSSLKVLPIQFYLIGLKWQPWTVQDMFLLWKIIIWSQALNMGDQYVRSNLLTNYTQEQVIEFLPFSSDKWSMFDLITQVTDQEVSSRLKSWTHDADIPKFKPKQIRDLLKIGLMEYIDDGRGSNSWAIHGNHTQNGFPLHAGDPHMASTIPNEWHQVRIQYLHKGRSVYFQGYPIAGLPIMIGRTQNISLAVTTIHSDTQDLYNQKTQGNHYWVDGKKYSLKKRLELIQIKNQPIQMYIVQETHRGPIINFVSHWGILYELNNQYKISLAWIGFHDNYDTLVAWSHLAQLQTVQDLQRYHNQSSHSGPNVNWVLATSDNHIVYMTTGTMPIRRNQATGNFIKEGSTSEHDWAGLIKNKDQIFLVDPPKGYIVSANNKPVSSKFHNGVYQSSILTARANRIDQMIQQKIRSGHKFTVQDMKKMQLDTVDVLCRQNMPSFIQGIQISRQYLNDFNCDFAKNSYQATIYEAFFYQLYRIINPSKSRNYNLLSSQNFYTYLHKYLRNHTNPQNKQNLVLAFQNTIKNLTDFYKTDKKEQWTWGKYHTDIISNRLLSSSSILKPLYERSFQGRGNLNTVNVGKMCKLSYGDFSINHRADIRAVWQHGPNPRSFMVLDTGVSQKFFSKHYDDQFQLFKNDKYVEVNFDKKPTSNKQQL